MNKGKFYYYLVEINFKSWTLSPFNPMIPVAAGKTQVARILLCVPDTFPTLLPGNLLKTSSRSFLTLSPG